MVLADYETKDNSMFSELAFNKSMIHLSARKYWHHISQIANLEHVKPFIAFLHPVVFSSAVIIHTKRRNRSTNDRVANLVPVYRHFEWEEKEMLFAHVPKRVKKEKKIIMMTFNLLPM